MGNKHPKAVVTDGDGAMREAIKEVFPNATHMLCSWHLQKNACENVKNVSFLEDFKKVMYSNFSVNEFEMRWAEIIEKHNLTNNNWVLKTYENRKMWAHAYLRDKFFGRIRTTSQCEGINSLIRAYIKKKNAIIEFMHNLDLALIGYRNNELHSDFKTFHGEPVITSGLHKIEAHAAKIFTRQIFMEVKSEIEKVVALNVVSCVDDDVSLTLKTNEFCSPNKKCELLFDKIKNTFLCDCQLLESRGIPCKHIFGAMKHMHIDTIPDTLICKRWTKDAKTEFINACPLEEVDPTRMVMLRHGSLASVCNTLCQVASVDVNDFIESREEVLKLIRRIQSRRVARSKQKTYTEGVGDPTVVKTKGAPVKTKYGGKKRRCSNCSKVGHYYRRYPNIHTSKCNKDQAKMDDNSTTKNVVDSSESEEELDMQENDFQSDNSSESSWLNERLVNFKKHARKVKSLMTICSTQSSVKQNENNYYEKDEQQEIHQKDTCKTRNVTSTFIHITPLDENVQSKKRKQEDRAIAKVKGKDDVVEMQKAPSHIEHTATKQKYKQIGTYSGFNTGCLHMSNQYMMNPSYPFYQHVPQFPQFYQSNRPFMYLPQMTQNLSMYGGMSNAQSRYMGRGGSSSSKKEPKKEGTWRCFACTETQVQWGYYCRGYINRKLYTNYKNDNGMFLLQY